MSKKSKRFSPEVCKRAARMVPEHRGEYPTLWATIESIAPKTVLVPQTLNDWVRQHEVGEGMRDGISSDDAMHIGWSRLACVAPDMVFRSSGLKSKCYCWSTTAALA